MISPMNQIKFTFQKDLHILNINDVNKNKQVTLAVYELASSFLGIT